MIRRPIEELRKKQQKKKKMKKKKKTTFDVKILYYAVCLSTRKAI